MNSVKLSVVIPAYNEAENIVVCLKALDAQRMSRLLFEVIVVDSGSTDGTMLIAQSVGSSLQLRVERYPGRSISGVRNYGASLANGDILVFLDADCVVPSDWLENGLAHAQGGGIWGAHYSVPGDATWVGQVWSHFQAMKNEGPASFIPGGDLFIGRRDFYSVGGFAEDLYTSEDVEFCARARSLGLTVVTYMPMAVLHNGTPRTLTHFYRQNRWHGRDVFRLFIKDLPSLRHLPLIALSLYTLVLFWFAILLSISEPWTHQGSWAVLSWLLLVMPATLLSLQKTVSSRQIQHAPALFVLYMAFFLARAAALTHQPARSHR